MAQGRRCLKHRQSNPLPRTVTKTTVTMPPENYSIQKGRKSPSRCQPSFCTRRRKIRAESSLHLQRCASVTHSLDGFSHPEHSYCVQFYKPVRLATYTVLILSFLWSLSSSLTLFSSFHAGKETSHGSLVNDFSETLSEPRGAHAT